MAGEAKTDQFMLGTATVMIGPQSEVFDLNPAEHSIGLVKNFQVQSQPGFTDLTQGVKNTQVYSVHTSNDVNTSMEVYEFTAKNLAYALGLDGSTLAQNTVESAVASAADGSSSPVTEITVDAGEGGNFADDDQLLISVDNQDNIITRKVSSITTDTLTVDKGINQLVPVGALVRKATVLRIGSTDLENTYYSAKVVGKFVNGKDIVVLFPKIKVVAGFTMAFQSSDYGNLPFEFKLFDSVTTDPHYADFNGEQAKAYMQ